MTRPCLSLLREMRLPMELAQLSHTPCLMALNAQLHLLLVLCPQANVTMLSWRKRHCPWLLALNVSTSTCMGESLRWSRTTSHSWQFLGPKQGIPPLAAARLQRWAVLLSAYTYDIQFKSTVAHGNADGLSRLPLPFDTR